VARDVLFKSRLLEIRANRCGRDDPALSRETPPLSWHEVTLPCHGIWYRHLGRTALPVDSHHVHFLNRGESHRVSHPHGCGDRNTGLVLQDDTLHDLARQVDPRATPEAPFTRTHARLQARTDAAHRALLDGLRREALDPLMVEELALRVVVRALAADRDAGSARAPLVKSQRDLAEAARCVLHRDLDVPLSLKDVAEAVASSPFHVCRVFAAHSGMSLHRYRVLLRLRSAIAMLLEGDQPLAAIAAATGFHDRSHLSRAFARHLGMSPAQMRQRARSASVRAMVEELLATG